MPPEPTKECMQITHNFSFSLFDMAFQRSYRTMIFLMNVVLLSCFVSARQLKNINNPNVEAEEATGKSGVGDQVVDHVNPSKNNDRAKMGGVGEMKQSPFPYPFPPQIPGFPFPPQIPGIPFPPSMPIPFPYPVPVPTLPLPPLPPFPGVPSLPVPSPPV